MDPSPCWTRPNVNPLSSGFGCWRSKQLQLPVPILLVEASSPPVIKHHDWLAHLLIREIVREKSVDVMESAIAMFDNRNVCKL